MASPFNLPTLARLMPMQGQSQTQGQRNPFGRIIQPPPQDGRGGGYLGPPTPFGGRGTGYLGPPTPNVQPRVNPPPNPFGQPAAQGQPFSTTGLTQPGQGRWYQPTPRQGVTNAYSFKPYHFGADVYQDPNGSGARMANAYRPTAANQGLWDAEPQQAKADIAGWHKDYQDSYFQLMQYGPQAVIFNGVQMSGFQAADEVRKLAWASRDAYNQARKANQPPPALSPFKINAGASYQVQ